MRVTFKLFATLMPYLPSGAVKNAAKVDVSAGTSVAQLIEKHQVPPELVHLVLLNGLYLREDERSRELREGDILAIWPPVAGG